MDKVAAFANSPVGGLATSLLGATPVGAIGLQAANALLPPAQGGQAQGGQAQGQPPPLSRQNAQSNFFPPQTKKWWQKPGVWAAIVITVIVVAGLAALLANILKKNPKGEIVVDASKIQSVKIGEAATTPKTPQLPNIDQVGAATPTGNGTGNATSGSGTTENTVLPEDENNPPASADPNDPARSCWTDADCNDPEFACTGKIPGPKINGKILKYCKPAAATGEKPDCTDPSNCDVCTKADNPDYCNLCNNEEECPNCKDPNANANYCDECRGAENYCIECDDKDNCPADGSSTGGTGGTGTTTGGTGTTGTTGGTASGTTSAAPETVDSCPGWECPIAYANRNPQTRCTDGRYACKNEAYSDKCTPDGTHGCWVPLPNPDAGKPGQPCNTHADCISPNGCMLWSHTCF